MMMVMIMTVMLFSMISMVLVMIIFPLMIMIFVLIGFGDLVYFQLRMRTLPNLVTMQ